ncbi:MAG: ABC transporter permease [Verrucomicrobia bacterium]|jgi:ABC-2 type transport system permease protein|nr:ABC transporter permease [Verrucomicrobiota bacterium]
MRVFQTLLRRELGFFLTTLTGYVILSMVMFLIGLSLLTVILAYNGRAMDAPLTEAFYGTPFFWFIVLLACPAITMRSFAHEKSTGTYEALMTTPVSNLQVVLSKFLASWVFYGLMWLPLWGFMAWLGQFFNDPEYLDAGIMGGTALGVMLLGGLFLAIGCLASVATKSQLIAAMLALTLEMVLFMLSFVIELLPDQSGWQAALFGHICLFDHMGDFVRGIIDGGHLVFYITTTGLFLFLTWRLVESRK